MPNKKRHLVVWIALGVVVLASAIGAGWILSLPSAPAPNQAPAITSAEADATLNQLKPRTAERPLIAIIGINDATEVTDYLVPYGVMKRSGVADVMLVATAPGPVRLYPALTVQPHTTVSHFDAQYPQGADYVMVPAMSRDDDPLVLEWLNHQSAKGATIIGVCAGAKIVGEAGLLDGKRATTHWYFVDELLDKHPSIEYVPDRRFVIDRGVATTTGITASMPIAFTLIEAIAGREKAASVARDLGLARWDASHDSSAFGLTRPFALTALTNTAALWNRETFGVELSAGVDEVSLALMADSWSRTYRSRAVTFSSSDSPVESSNGVRLLPDRVASSWPADTRLPLLDNQTPVAVLDSTLDGITARYGERTASMVAMQLEYPRPAQGGVRTDARRRPSGTGRD